MTKLGFIAAAALLASVSVASAQTSSTTGAPSAASNQGKCWDAATNQMRDHQAQMGSNTSTGTTGTSGNLGTAGGSAGFTGSTGSGLGNTTGTGSGTGTGSSASAGGSASGTAGSGGQNRPAHAMGLPNC
jgi:hypothetical protein